MADLDEQVLLPVVGKAQVVPEQGSLGLPVQPDAPGAVVDHVPGQVGIHGGVQLDSGDLSPVEFSPDVDVVDVVFGDVAEGAAHAAHDSGLAAVPDFVSAQDVPAHMLPAPASLQGGEDHLGVGLGTTLAGVLAPAVVLGIVIFAQADAAALGVVDAAVLDHPAPAPVGTHRAGLKGRGRGPLSGGAAALQARQSDIVDAFLPGEKAEGPHADFGLQAVGVLFAEADMKDRLFLFHLGKPFPRFAGGLIHQGGQRGGLVQRLAVREQLAGVVGLTQAVVPVTKQLVRIGVVFTEHRVVHSGTPDPVFTARPATDRLRAGDDRPLALGSLVDNALVIALAAPGRSNPLPVDALMNENRVTGSGNGGCLSDGLERSCGRAVAPGGGMLGNGINHDQSPSCVIG